MNTPPDTYGCDGCRYLVGHRCKLWEVAVKDAANSHCESFAKAEGE